MLVVRGELVVGEARWRWKQVDPATAALPGTQQPHLLLGVQLGLVGADDGLVGGPLGEQQVTGGADLKDNECNYLLNAIFNS